jgi:hypothetical protein
MSRLFRTLLRWLTESIIVHRPLCSCALGSVALCSVLCLAHVEGIRAPLSASLFCRRERNRSHDDEFHRHAQRFLLSVSYPPVIQTSVLTQKKFRHKR